MLKDDVNNLITILLSEVMAAGFLSLPIVGIGYDAIMMIHSSSLILIISCLIVYLIILFQ